MTSLDHPNRGDQSKCSRCDSCGTLTLISSSFTAVIRSIENTAHEVLEELGVETCGGEVCFSVC